MGEELRDVGVSNSMGIYSSLSNWKNVRTVVKRILLLIGSLLYLGYYFSWLLFLVVGGYKMEHFINCHYTYNTLV